MTIGNLTDKFRVYPNIDSHHKDKDATYVNVRVVARKNRNKTIDIPLYFEDGVRVKVKAKSFERGKVKKGYYTDLETRLINDRILSIWQQIKDYLNTTGDKISKATIENHVYGESFIKQFKQTRLKSLVVTETKRKVSDAFIQLRKSYPKRIEVEIHSYIDSDGFERDERKEVVVDPLDFNAVDFPKNFPTELYNELAKEYKGSDNSFFKNSFVQMKAALLLYSNEVSETIKISTEALQQFKETKSTKKINPINYTVTIGSDRKNVNNKSELIDIQRQIDITKMATEDVYKKGLFKRDNLLHVFGSIYYDTLENKQNERIVIRLFDYVSNTHASTNVKEYDEAWIKDFMSWINEKGYSNQSAKMFDPLKFNPQMFIDKERERYNGAGLKKQLVSLRIVGRHLEKKGLLPFVDYDKIKIGEWRKVEEGTRNTHNLLIDEFDKLFKLQFDSSKLKQYKKVFDTLRGSGIIKGTYSPDISIKNLEKYRDVFCLQTMIGGLRGLDEYNTVELIEFDAKGQVFRLRQEKVNKTLLNPHNTYTSEILRRNNNGLPKANDYEVMNGYLKLISHIAGLNREVEKGITIKDNISQYWARKTFGNILFTEGVSEDQIALFTGHETRKSELAKSYLDLQNVQLKRKIYQSIKF
jgi:hypothetical protein